MAVGEQRPSFAGRLGDGNHLVHPFMECQQLLSVRRGNGTLGAQIEDQLRRAIRSGTLRPGTPLPSTRDLARQLGVSRRIAVDAYDQLAAEGRCGRG